MKSIDLTSIIQAFILLISSVITIYIIPKVKSYLAEKLSAEQRENLKQWVKIAVAAAEQMYNERGLGDDKFRYVVSFLEEKGLNVNYKEIEALVESEVYKLTQGSGYFVAVPEGDTASTETNTADTTEDDTDETAPDEESETATAEVVG